MADRPSIIQIPMLSDNYAYLLVSGMHAAVIDPAEDGPVIEHLTQLGLTLSLILCTHHHGDHAGGNRALKKKYAAPVFGPQDPRVPELDEGLADGRTLAFGRSAIRVLHVPGHTRSHLAFHCEEAVFTGDTLFASGCGRVFEGTPEQMWASLLRLRALPAETLVYCGHEYTEENCAFAVKLEPHNPLAVRRYEEVRKFRAAGKPSVPSMLSLEKTTNPFLRCDDPEFKNSVGMGSAEDAGVFAEIRRRKDRF